MSQAEDLASIDKSTENLASSLRGVTKEQERLEKALKTKPGDKDLRKEWDDAEKRKHELEAMIGQNGELHRKVMKKEKLSRNEEKSLENIKTAFGGKG